jgi:pimeloyl-ACP methyl ester carboxylesterase
VFPDTVISTGRVILDVDQAVELAAGQDDGARARGRGGGDRGGRLHQVAVPTLVAWGRQDALVSVVYAAEFDSRITGSQVKIIDDCGHVMQADQPQEVLAVISDFLPA